MPRAAIELGGAQTSMPVTDIARRLCAFASAPGERRDAS
jgi:chemotaxis response regulator CheB